MNPSEAARTLALVEGLEKRLRTLENAVKSDGTCARLRLKLERAEAEVRARVRPDMNSIHAELRPMRDALKAWEAASANAAAADAPLDHTRRVSMTLVPRLKRPRHDARSDWSSERVVLARYGPLELLWWQSGKSWVDQLQGHQAFGGTLMAKNISDNRDVLGNEFAKGGRLSRARLLSLAGKINAFFGIPDVAENLDWKQTLIIEDL
jgi:hypothetical protein